MKLVGPLTSGIAGRHCIYKNSGSPVNSLNSVSKKRMEALEEEQGDLKDHTVYKRRLRRNFKTMYGEFSCEVRGGYVFGDSGQ